MRLWMVDPKILCRQHLLGEHVECHMFLGAIIRGKSIRGYVDGGLVEAHNLAARHDQLAQEMAERKYNHQSPFPADFHHGELGQVDRDRSLQDLIARCPKCRERHDGLFGKK